MLRNAQIEASRPEVNGSLGTNGHVNGRGLAHRPAAARLALGVDVATGRKKLDPSLGQIADACGVTYTQLRKAIRARANGNGHEDTATAVAKAHIRTIVDLIGINAAMDLLSEVEGELLCVK
jgi:hypothetical protein